MKIKKKILNIRKKYILCQTIEELNNFENQTFVHMLQDIGIKKEEYLMALRGSVKISFQFLPKRECRDDESIIFPNIIEYYENRPDALEEISLAHFAAYYEYFKVMYSIM